MASSWAGVCWVEADVSICHVSGAQDTHIPTKCLLSKCTGGDLCRMPKSWRLRGGHSNASSLFKPDVKTDV